MRRLFLDILDCIADFIGDSADRLLTPAGIVVLVIFFGPNLAEGLQGRVLDMAFGAMTPTVLKRTSGKVRETVEHLREKI